MRKSIYTVQVLMMSGFMLSQSVQATTPNAETLAYTCFGCHGVNGNSKGPATPSLAGLDAKYIVESMQAFKTDERAGTIMGRIARGYSDEEIELVAGFFSMQKTSAKAQSADRKIISSTANNEPENLNGKWNPQLQYALLDFLSSKDEAFKLQAKQTDIKNTNALEVN